jgi:hypothetical protein
MKCAKCKTEVSMTDKNCPKCGNDLLQFGATVFYESKDKNSGRYGQGIKDMVFGALRDEVEESVKTLDFSEIKVFQPLENRLKLLLSRHLSDLEIDDLFDKEIIPTVDDLSRNKDAEKIFQKVELEMKDNLSLNIYNHYKNKGDDVLKILRAGEITHILIKENGRDIDLSVKMFPYFKASEKACWLHIRRRYNELRDNPLLKNIADWLGRNEDHILIDNIPEWLNKRKKTLIEVMNGILTENDYFTGGSLRTGVSIFVLGRNWNLKIERRDLSKTEIYRIDNILKTGGTDKAKEILADNLQKLQVLRNERMHKDVEDNEKTVQSSRTLSYNCLKAIPEILEI